MSSVHGDNEQGGRSTLLVRVLRLVRELAEASLLVIAFAVAILVVGTPIALAVRALHEILSWLLRSL